MHNILPERALFNGNERRLSYLFSFSLFSLNALSIYYQMFSSEFEAVVLELNSDVDTVKV